MALQWLPCQAPGVIGSVLGLIGPVSVCCDWVRWKVWSATSISVRQHVILPEQIRPWDTLTCCWDVKQPTNKPNYKLCMVTRTLSRQETTKTQYVELVGARLRGCFIGYCGFFLSSESIRFSNPLSSTYKYELNTSCERLPWISSPGVWVKWGHVSTTFRDNFSLLLLRRTLDGDACCLTKAAVLLSSSRLPYSLSLRSVESGHVSHLIASCSRQCCSRCLRCMGTSQTRQPWTCCTCGR